MVNISISGATKSAIGVAIVGAIAFVILGAAGSQVGGMAGEMALQLFEFGKTAFIFAVLALIAIVVAINWHKFR